MLLDLQIPVVKHEENKWWIYPKNKATITELSHSNSKARILKRKKIN